MASHWTWHGSGTALGLVVTILAKFPKPTLSGKIGRCPAVTMAVPLGCLCSLPKRDGGIGCPMAVHRRASGGEHPEAAVLDHS
jgi:hypothetical protein